MMKFYRQEARRILAGPKKKSTIQITLWSGSWSLLGRKMLTAKRMSGKAYGTSDSARRLCGKAEDGSGYPGRNQEAKGQPLKGWPFY
jgi:hypothetical protein